MKKSTLVPLQREGSKSDTSYSVKCPTEKEAAELFKKSAAKLLNVNKWHEIAGSLTAVFSITDKAGNEANHLASCGDYFRISVPGPAPASGDGFDWVKVEAIDDMRDPKGTKEEVSLRVRPTQNPSKPADNTAHFFTNHATSTFIVRRERNRVSAEVHGRNEKPNTEAEKGGDKLRNAVVAAGAISGLAKIQWKSLVKGLLKNGQKEE